MAAQRSTKPPGVDPIQLKLDAKNPRFAAHGGGRRSESNIIRYLWDSADLRELVGSIAANGYIDLEPLIVMDEDGDGRLTVIEGNRRVAAIKLLRTPKLAADLGFALPTVNPAKAKTLESAKILKVHERDDARQFIGFKHINGPHKWDAYAKGKFAADWYRAEQAQGVTIRDIAQRLGDRHDTIQRLVNGIYVLQQAERLGLFDIDDRAPGRPFFFSHLYTALTRAEYRAYLGLAPEWRRVEPQPDPIPATHVEQLKQVLAWIYGSTKDDLEPLVRSQNPHIKQLGEVLSHPGALRRLVATRDLARAYAEVATRARKFEEALIQAVTRAEEAQGCVDGYGGDDALFEYGERLVAIAQNLVGLMKTADERANEEPAS